MIVLTNTTYNKTELSLFTLCQDFQRWPVASQLGNMQVAGSDRERNGRILIEAVVGVVSAQQYQSALLGHNPKQG